MELAAAYIRVSTDDQTELSPDSQISQIREYAKRNGYYVPDDLIFRDDGISGKTASKRPAFQRMIGIAKTKPKPFEAILLWKYSRFARNREDSIVYKSMLRKQCGIDVISISENLGDDKMSILIEALIEAMDEYYSVNLSEEVKRGMLEKFNRGQVVSTPPLGYKSKDGKFIPDEFSSLIVRIFNDFQNGKGSRTIATELNDEGYKTARGNRFENRTIEYILRNPCYIGMQRWCTNGRGAKSHYHDDNADVLITKGAHEPIIDTDLFNQVQEKINLSKEMYSKFDRKVTPKKEFAVAGLVKCSNCGASLCATSTTAGTLNLQCHKYAKGQCTVSHGVKAHAILALLIADMRERLEKKSFVLEMRNNNIPKAKNLKSAIAKETDKLNRVKLAYENGIDSLEEYKANKLAITERLKNLEAEQNKKIDVQAITQKFYRQVEKSIIVLEDETVSQKVKNDILRRMIKRIVYSKANRAIEVFYYA